MQSTMRPSRTAVALLAFLLIGLLVAISLIEWSRRRYTQRFVDWASMNAPAVAIECSGPNADPVHCPTTADAAPVARTMAGSLTISGTGPGLCLASPTGGEEPTCVSQHQLQALLVMAARPPPAPGQPGPPGPPGPIYKLLCATAINFKVWWAR